ncbi:MAG: hypothetical protein Q4F95_11885 [Oscillospiraceae bacterium]|nr:hypothetical protein [Oscillospiraceae bacterium]
MKTNDFIKRVPLFFLLLQFVTAAILNFTRSQAFLDFDSALALRHAVEMWKDKSIAFANFAPVSSFEIDCPAFFAAPLYILTSSIGFSYGISHTFFLAVFCAVVFDVCKNSGLKFSYGCLANILILTPYTLGQLDYFNMLFISAGQYEFRAITMFLLIDLLLIKNFKKKRSLAVLAAFTFFLGLTTLSVGSYMLVMVVVPLCAYAIASAIFDKKSVKLCQIFLLAGSCIFCIIIIWGRKHFFGVSGRTQYLCTYQNLFDNIINCITGVFAFLGAAVKQSHIKVGSLNSIAALAKLVFFSVVFIFQIVVIRRFKLLKTSPVVRICCIFSAVHLFVLSVTDTRYGSAVFESRYHILWILENFVCAVYCISVYMNSLKSDENGKKLRVMICLSTTAAILISNITGYININKYNTQYTDRSMQILETAKENDVSAIILYGDDAFGRNAHIIRALDTDMNALWINDNCQKAYILDYFWGAADSAAMGPANILVTPADKFKELPEYIKCSYTFVKEDENDCYYKTIDNKWDIQAGFPVYLDYSEDYPTTPGFKKGFDPDTKERTLQAEFISPGDANIYTYDICVELDRDSKEKNTAELILEGKDCTLEDTDEDGKLSLSGITLRQGEKLKLRLQYGIKTDIIKIIYTRTAN